MTRLTARFFLASISLLLSCQTENDDDFATKDDDLIVIEDDDQTPSSDDDSAADDDAGDDDAGITWDPSPPTDTNFIGVTFTCAFLVATTGACFRFEDGDWRFINDETCSPALEFTGQPIPELADCQEENEPVEEVSWSESGHLVFGTQLVHELDPVPSVANRWIGQVYSSIPVVNECLIERASALGITYPFLIIMDRVF